MADVAKSGARVSARQHFEGTLSAIARDLRNRLEFLAVCTSYPWQNPNDYGKPLANHGLLYEAPLANPSHEYGQPHANLGCLYEAPSAKSKSLVWETPCKSYLCV